MDKVLVKGTPIIFHFRVDRRTNKLIDPQSLGEIRKSPYLSARGGVTVVFNPGSRTFGSAVCSLDDSYNLSRGRAIAEGRSKQTPNAPRQPNQNPSKVPMHVTTYDGAMTLSAVRTEAYRIAEADFTSVFNRCWQGKNKSLPTIFD